jgi:uncharacterized protein with FMN-binding domain
MDDKTTETNHKAVITFLAVVIIAIVVTVAVIAAPKKSQTDQANTTKDTTSTNTATSTATTTSFKNGRYSATGSYESPGGEESISIQVTLNNGIITATSATPGTQDSESAEYQAMFISGYKSQVIGKNIADITLSRVSGSSLTSQGFNDAISKIEDQAKA